MDELIAKSAEIYDSLMMMYDSRKDVGYQETVKEMVFSISGTCSIKAYRTRIADNDCMEIDWVIVGSGYDGYNMITNDRFSDWVRFIEDLTMAYYSSNGGTGYNTYGLMEAIGR